MENPAALSVRHVPMGPGVDIGTSFWKLNRMQKALRARLNAGLLCAFFALVIGPSAVLAQSGSAGGSIGNDEKSLSGTRSEPRSAAPESSSPRSKLEDELRGSSSKRSGGGGGGSFDGAWVVASVGTNCSGGSTTAVVVSSGRIIGQGVSGTVSPSGAASAVGNSNGIRVISSGRLSGRRGSGSFRQSDGCIGRWTATKN
jgi:hypothetical protein